MRKVLIGMAVLGGVLCFALPATAATTSEYVATYVEPVGGPNESPFSCAPGTTCGSVNIAGIGRSESYFATFNVCGFGCHVRTITFAGGSTLLIRVEDQPSGFAFTSPGNSGSHGYIGFPGVSGNPQFLDVKETIIGGTGQFSGASGSGSGTVALHGGMAIGKTSGTITLP